jgi:hypothetical protein
LMAQWQPCARECVFATLIELWPLNVSLCPGRAPRRPMNVPLQGPCADILKFVFATLIELYCCETRRDETESELFRDGTLLSESEPEFLNCFETRKMLANFKLFFSWNAYEIFCKREY